MSSLPTLKTDGRDPAGSVRADVVLRKLAREYLLAEMARRGCRLSEAINSILLEHRLLSRIQDAQKFRHETREELQAVKLLARQAAAAAPGSRERAEALRQLEALADAASGRLVLVTAL